MIRTWLLFCILSVVFLSSQAQTTDPVFERNRIGLYYGFGGKSLEFVKLATRYQYEIRQIEIQYSYLLFPGRTIDLDVVVSPQVNLTRFNSEFSTTGETKGEEWGFTAGLAPRIHSEDRNMAIYLLVSSGPIYVTGTPERQAHGINFASNFMAGVYYQIMPKVNLDFRSGFRHLSNSQIRYPNAGLNNLVWSVGVNYALTSFKKKQSRRMLAGVAH